MRTQTLIRILTVLIMFRVALADATDPEKDYRAEVAIRVRDSWLALLKAHPSMAEKGYVRVLFEVGRDGDILNLKVGEPKRPVSVADTVVAAALIKTELPKMPDAIYEEFARKRMVFRFSFRVSSLNEEKKAPK